MRNVQCTDTTPNVVYRLTKECIMELKFTIVENQSMLEKLFWGVNYFHDAFVKEVSLLTDSYIDV
jgi:hypothetical protein